MEDTKLVQVSKTDFLITVEREYGIEVLNEDYSHVVAMLNSIDRGLSGQPVGSFISAVCEGRWADAKDRADHINIDYLELYEFYIAAKKGEYSI